MAMLWIILSLFVWIQSVTGVLTNVALNKPASISSTYGGNEMAPGGAVDGVITTTYATGIIHTAVGQNSSWWTVDLQTQVQDATVKIYFRTERQYTFNRNGVQLYTSTTPFSTYPSGQLCHAFTGSNIPDVGRANCTGTWRYLMVYTNTNIDGRGPILQFGEVEVWACSAGTYGKNCDKTCSSRQCAVTTTSCDRYTGACSAGGCKAGWRGIDCTQVCPSGSYGMGCNSSCTGRKCSTSSSTACHHVTGECDQRCQPGWREIDCAQECSSGSYGNQCNQMCSSRHCVTSSNTCNHVTGVCPVDGCEAGWMGSDCTQECTAGTYGPNCEKSCSSRQCMIPSSNCDRVTGQCPDGCQVGWIGEDCTSVLDCPEGTFGADCLTCSKRHCEGVSDCPADGTCSRGCQDGWTLDTCTQVCPSGTYGAGCASTCGNCTGDYACHHVTGNCPRACRPGWRGSQCKQTCLSGKYGANCEENCGQCIGTCDVVDGHCPDGCVDGYCGSHCNKKLEAPSTGPDPVTITVTAAVVIVLMFGMGGGTFFCLIRSGRLKWVKAAEESTEMDDITNAQVISRTESERPQSGCRHVYNNDYDVLDVETKPDNKEYDVIGSRCYENT